MVILNEKKKVRRRQFSIIIGPAPEQGLGNVKTKVKKSIKSQNRSG